MKESVVKMTMTKVELVGIPTQDDLMWCKECTLGTMGKEVKTPPDTAFLHRILRARHSPIRELWYRFRLTDVPTWVSVHLVRHHMEFHPYVRSQRNDRQNEYDRNAARQDAPVDMRISMNAEMLMTLANKRLCAKASPETRAVVAEMCRLVEEKCPEFRGLLVPMCEYHGGVCYEIRGCGKCPAKEGL